MNKIAARFFSRYQLPITRMLVLGALSLSGLNAFAQQRSFSVDPNTSEVAITLGASLHSVHGTFHVTSGSVKLNEADQSMEGLITVAAGSGSSGDAGRDKKMDTEVLDAPHFADITFAPHGYKGTIAATGDSTVQVTGTFTLHGTPHELTAPMQVHVDGSTCTAKTQFMVPFVSWGLKDPSTFLLKVSKEVQVNLTLAGTLTPTR